jgi:hypothetical protein
MNMRNYWKWVIGGGLAFWAYKALAQPQETRVGILRVTVQFQPGNDPQRQMRIDAILAALLKLNAACSGAPRVQKSYQWSHSHVSNQLNAEYVAGWSTDVQGPIRETVRACLQGYLQTVDATVAAVSAERIS